MSDFYQSLSHSRPDSKSNITQCESPKRRRKAVFGKLRRRLRKAPMLWPGREKARSWKGISCSLIRLICRFQTGAFYFAAT